MDATHTLNECWSEKTLSTEYTLHQIAPYIGKLKSSIAKGLILHYTKEGDTVYDPYCGASTIPLEACILNRHVYANDLNPYAYLLSLAKLYPPSDINQVLEELSRIALEVEIQKKMVDLRKTPKWVRAFFHKETLREIIVWVKILKENKNWFLFSCLLGILHHQRPGFLSYPSSHSVPYLRVKKFPIDQFPDMYSYRNVHDRLIKKVNRAFKRMPSINENISRICTNGDAINQSINVKVDSIITSPPYMRQLDYARDNRLRLWFIGHDTWKSLDNLISPSERDFIEGFKTAMNNWKYILKDSGKCILILGDNYCSSYRLYLPDVIEKIAVEEVGGYKLIFRMQSFIPEKSRVRKNCKGNKYESILVFEKT